MRSHRWKSSTASSSPACRWPIIFQCCETMASALFPAPPQKSLTTRFATFSFGEQTFHGTMDRSHPAPRTVAAFARPQRSCTDTPKLPRTGCGRCGCCATFNLKLEASPSSCPSASCIKTRCSSSKDWHARAQRWPSISAVACAGTTSACGIHQQHPRFRAVRLNRSAAFP